MDKKEWDNVGIFLRRVYSAADDLTVIGKSITDPDKKKAGVALVADLQKYAKAGEPSINAKDGPGIIAIFDKSETIINDYLELLRDIPDEI